MVQEYACSVGKLLRNTTRLMARIHDVLGNAYVRNEYLYVNADKSEQFLVYLH